MESRICEYCGEQFISETRCAKIFDAIFPLDLILAVYLGLSWCSEGGAGWIGGIIALLYIIGRIRAKSARRRAKAAKRFKVGRKCPSCGEKSAEVNSPLGKQLLEKWPSPDSD